MLGLQDNAIHDKLLLGIKEDLEHADSVIINALSLSSWLRNASWAMKFAEYVKQRCPHLVSGESVARAVVEEQVVVAFLANVDRNNPGKKTVVKSARRATNTLRAFLENHAMTDLLTKAAAKSGVSTVR